MNTLGISLNVPEDRQDLVIAYLDDFGFEGFVQEGTRLEAFVAEDKWRSGGQAYLEQLLEREHLQQHWTEQIYAPQNWNEKWEETIQPIVVDRFVVRPTWTNDDPSYKDLITILIDPKMSFGTGYHESTRLMLRLLPEFVRPGSTVLDVGTGTGILAIAAMKLGAGVAIGCDVDPWAQANARENFALNEVSVEFREGSFEAIAEKQFNVIIANIQRNVLLGMMPKFQEHIAPDGHLLLAGLLYETDRTPILNAAAQFGFTPLKELQEGAWWSVALQYRVQ